MTSTGPIPGDTVFVRALGGEFDAVVAMYHDQGHIPLKMLGFAIDPVAGMTALSGVNVTLGLPIVRTSVDHGTAFDIAGKGIASAQSMVEAIEFALRLVAARLGRGRELTPPNVRRTLADIEPLRELQQTSMRALGPGYYSQIEVETAIRCIFVPDRDLIEDGTYLLAELGGRLVGCGGWSLRRKHYAGRPTAKPTPSGSTRASSRPRFARMFTAPEVARQGVGRAILAAAETAASATGFRRRGSAPRSAASRSTGAQATSEIAREAASLPDGARLAVILIERA